MSSNSQANTISASEEALIASAKSGDNYAFAALADSYKRILEMQIRLLSPPESIRDDLFQEGLVGLFKAVKTYDGKSSSFATYATHCVRNSIISGIRKYSAQTAKTVVLSAAYAEDETVPSAEEVLLDDVRARALYDRVISYLSPYERLVFDMYLSDMPYENIAFVTGKSVKSTSNAVYRIRTKLKQIVNDDLRLKRKIPKKG